MVRTYSPSPVISLTLASTVRMHPAQHKAAGHAKAVTEKTAETGWYAGVSWNRGETVRYWNLEDLNGHSVPFFKCADDIGVRYTFTSHFHPRAFVQLGNFRVDGLPRENRMVVFLEASENRTTFEFAKAVRTELDWLNDTGIVRMTPVERENVQYSLNRAGTGHYWTSLSKTIIHTAGAFDAPAHIKAHEIPGGSECGNPCDFRPAAVRAR